MGADVTRQLRDKGVYLACTGGCAVLAASKMSLKGVYFEELGMAEAIWIIELDSLPLVVGIDSHGNDLFTDVTRQANKQFHRLFT
jgi:fumarate hydratase subunit beta